MRCVLPVFALLSLAFAPAPFPKPDSTKHDLNKLQGTWTRVSLTIGGRRHDEGLDGTTIVITGTRLQFPTPHDAWMISLNAKKSPKLFDYTGATPTVKDFVFRGIYRLEGDTLTICCNQGKEDKNRPTKFESAGGHVWLQVFKRKRP
jgi:uncharacterized protein (TIGR03067 family)